MSIWKRELALRKQKTRPAFRIINPLFRWSLILCDSYYYCIKTCLCSIDFPMHDHACHCFDFDLRSHTFEQRVLSMEPILMMYYWFYMYVSCETCVLRKTVRVFLWIRPSYCKKSFTDKNVTRTLNYINVSSGFMGVISLTYSKQIWDKYQQPINHLEPYRAADKSWATPPTICQRATYATLVFVLLHVSCNIELHDFAINLASVWNWSISCIFLAKQVVPMSGPQSTF